MGGSGSKQSQLDKYGQLLSSQEKEALSRNFTAIAGAQEADSFGETQLKAYFSGPQLSLPRETISNLFGALCSEQRSKDQVTFASFILHASHLLKGSISQKAPLLNRICGSTSPTGTTSLTLAQLESALLVFLNVILSSEFTRSAIPHITSWSSSDESARRLASCFTEPLKEKLGSSEQTISVGLSDFETWLASSFLALRIIEIALALCFYREVISFDSTPLDIRNYLGIDTNAETGETNLERFVIPAKTQHPLYRDSFDSRLLDQSSLILLNSHFPPEIRGGLHPLFSSVQHGESFSTFCKQLVDKGPTLVVVRDTGGHVFGGFSAESWQFNPQFTGSAGCFLFTLAPKMGVYAPTGYNENYMYLQQNAQTLPNGLGMGGQVDYFGLWLSADYGNGHSRAKPRCTTYGSPMLSSSEEFQVDLLEVWGVGSHTVPEKEGTSQPSILDRDKTATAILEMAGKAMHSKDLRTPEEGAEDT